MGRYYVKTSRDGRAQGPFTREQLTGLASAGKLQGDHLVSKDGHEWYIAGNIRDLPLAGSPGPTRAPAAASDPADLAARAAAQHRPVHHVAPARANRFPAVLIAGLIFALLAVVVLTVYFLHGGNGEDDGPGPVAAPRPPQAGPAAPAVPPSPGPAIPAPPPKPKGQFEPPKPPGSYQVLSVRYGGQVVRAMGSQLAFVLTNNTGKGIQSVQGTIRLYDASDTFLVALPMEITHAIDDGASVTKKGVWLEVGGLTLGMLDESSDNMKFKFAADEVTYEDGQAKTF